MKKIIIFAFVASIVMLFILDIINVVSAEEVGSDVTSDSGEFFNVCDYTGHDNSLSKFVPENVLYFRGGDLKNVACYIVKNYRTDKDGTVISRYCFKTSLTLPVTIKREFWNHFLDKGKTDRATRVDSQNTNGVPVEASEASVHCYVFSDEAKVDAYLRGEIDASEAENFGEVTPSDYNSDIPLPDVFEIKYLDRSTVDCFFSYSNDSEISAFGKELHYEIVPDYVYATTSFTKAIVGGTALGATGNAAKMCQYIQSTVQGGVMNLPVTVEAYIKNPKDNKNKLYTQSDKTPVTGTVSASNSRSLTPADYSGQFASSSAFSAFWGGATNLNKAYFVGAQLSLRIYYVENGKTYYSNKVVVRYFSNDIINSLIGKKKTVVGKDDKGDDIVIDEGPTEPTTPVGPGDLKDVDLVSYMKRLFVSVTGYMALMQSTFSFVPGEIWYLITAALAVSLVIVVINVLRG